MDSKCKRIIERLIVLKCYQRDIEEIYENNKNSDLSNLLKYAESRIESSDLERELIDRLISAHTIKGGETYGNKQTTVKRYTDDNYW